MSKDNKPSSVDKHNKLSNAVGELLFLTKSLFRFALTDAAIGHYSKLQRQTFFRAMPLFGPQSYSGSASGDHCGGQSFR
jgi:hypothetical protein